jgi:hypothetical protein
MAGYRTYRQSIKSLTKEQLEYAQKKVWEEWLVFTLSILLLY